jgi:hypothetical protein
LQIAKLIPEEPNSSAKSSTISLASGGIRRAQSRVLNLKIMPQKDENLLRLQSAIERAYHCLAEHSQTVSVQEMIEGQTVWQGEVEVFDLHDNTAAKKCYAWLYPGSSGERFVAVLESQLVSSAAMAVRYAIFYDTQPAPCHRSNLPS